MLYIFHGNDVKKVLHQSQKMIEALRSKREFAQVFYVHADAFNKENLDIQQTNQGLFFDKHIFVFKNFIGAKKEVRDYVLKNLEKFRDSHHLYIILEDEIDPKYISNLNVLDSANVKEFKTKVTAKEDVSGKMFNLVGAIVNFKSRATKNQTDMINIIQQVDEVKKRGTAPEEFFGILWWRYKKYASKDKVNMRKLLDIYHDGHGGEEDMWSGIEAWLIS